MDESIQTAILRFWLMFYSIISNIIFMSILQFIAIFGAVSFMIFGLLIFIGSVIYILMNILKMRKPSPDITRNDLPSYDSLYHQNNRVPKTGTNFTAV
jgi:hypothetical protein